MKNFSTETMANGSVCLSASPKEITVMQLEKAVKALYDERITGMHLLADPMAMDDYYNFFKIDGIEFCIAMEWETVSFEPMEKAGEKYVLELIDFLNANPNL